MPEALVRISGRSSVFNGNDTGATAARLAFRARTGKKKRDFETTRTED